MQERRAELYCGNLCLVIIVPQSASLYQPMMPRVACLGKQCFRLDNGNYF